MRYPRANNRLVWKRVSEDTYEIRDRVTCTTYTAGSLIVRVLKNLDGKRDPCSLMPELSAEEVRMLLDKMGEAGLVRTSRVLVNCREDFSYALLFARHTRARSPIPALLDVLRMALWLPMLLCGVWLLLNASLDRMGGSSWLGLVLGLVVGGVGHEFSHVVSCLHWGGRWFEAGVFLNYYVLPGMYVLLDNKPVRGRLRRVLITGAGIEMNLLLTGLFCLLAVRYEALGQCFFYAACCNLSMVAVNLLPVRSLDGMGMLGHLLGTDDAVEQAKDILRSRAHCAALLQKSVVGWAELVACGLLVLMQAAFPALILICILNIWRLVT